MGNVNEEVKNVTGNDVIEGKEVIMVQEKKKFYETKPFLIGVGAIAGMALGAGVVVAYNHFKDDDDPMSSFDGEAEVDPVSSFEDACSNASIDTTSF